MIYLKAVMLYVFCPPFLGGTEDWKERSGRCHALGENCTSQMETALFAKPFAFWCSFSVRAFKERAGQGGVGPLTHLLWGLWQCSCESGKPCCPQVWSEAECGFIIPKSHLVCTCWLGGAVQMGLSDSIPPAHLLSVLGVIVVGSEGSNPVQP